MKKISTLFVVLSLVAVFGCETVHEGTKAVGSVVGEGASVVGGLSEGGAQAVQKPITDSENPFGR